MNTVPLQSNVVIDFLTQSYC